MSRCRELTKVIDTKKAGTDEIFINVYQDENTYFNLYVYEHTIYSVSEFDNMRSIINEENIAKKIFKK